MTFTNRIDIVQ